MYRLWWVSHTVRWLLKGKAKLLRGQRGLALLEVIIAVGLLAAIGIAFVVAMSTAYKSVGIVDAQGQAEALIRSQLDDIKASTYQDSYSVTVAVPNQYSVSINVKTLDSETCVADGNCNTLQEIKVSVSLLANGENKPVLAVSTYKVKE